MINYIDVQQFSTTDFLTLRNQRSILAVPNVQYGSRTRKRSQRVKNGSQRDEKTKINLATYCQKSSIQWFIFSCYNMLCEACVARCSPNPDLSHAQTCLGTAILCRPVLPNCFVSAWRLDKNSIIRYPSGTGYVFSCLHSMSKQLFIPKLIVSSLIW